MLVKFIGRAAPIRIEYGPWLMGSCIGRTRGALLFSQCRSRRRTRLRRSIALANWTGIHAIGSAVVDLIFSIANRDVTFFSGTAPISRL